MLPIAYSKAVAEARASGQPVVALETSVLSQGLPQPQNLETALAMEDAVRGTLELMEAPGEEKLRVVLPV